MHKLTIDGFLDDIPSCWQLHAFQIRYCICPYPFDEPDGQVRDSLQKYHFIYAFVNFVGRIVHLIWNQGDIYGVGRHPMINIHYQMLRSLIHCDQDNWFSLLNPGRVLTQRKRFMPARKMTSIALPLTRRLTLASTHRSNKTQKSFPTSPH